MIFSSGCYSVEERNIRLEQHEQQLVIELRVRGERHEREQRAREEREQRTCREQDDRQKKEIKIMTMTKLSK